MQKQGNGDGCGHDDVIPAFIQGYGNGELTALVNRKGMCVTNLTFWGLITADWSSRFGWFFRFRDEDSIISAVVVVPASLLRKKENEIDGGEILGPIQLNPDAAAPVLSCEGGLHGQLIMRACPLGPN